MTSDPDLIYAHDNGDEHAFNKLVQLHLRSVYNFALRVSNNAEDAEDITQITFVKAWSSLHTFSRERNFKTWLFTIAHNATIDVLRKKRDVPMGLLRKDDEETAFEEHISDIELLPDEIVMRAEEKKLLHVLLEKLPAYQREVLLLYFQEHRTLAEIASIRGESINTVKSRHLRGLQRLRQLFLDAPK